MIYTRGTHYSFIKGKRKVRFKTALENTIVLIKPQFAYCISYIATKKQTSTIKSIKFQNWMALELINLGLLPVSATTSQQVILT